MEEGAMVYLNVPEAWLNLFFGRVPLSINIKYKVTAVRKDYIWISDGQVPVGIFDKRFFSEYNSK